MFAEGLDQLVEVDLFRIVAGNREKEVLALAAAFAPGGLVEEEKKFF